MSKGKDLQAMRHNSKPVPKSGVKETQLKYMFLLDYLLFQQNFSLCDYKNQPAG